jgi:hypothetical protein
MSTVPRMNGCGTPAGVTAPRQVAAQRSRHLRSPRTSGVVAVLCVLMVCGAPAHAAATDPPVDFTAHLEHQGLVIDQARSGEPAVVAPAGSLFSNGANYVLQAGGKTLAGLWVKDPGHVTVRRTADPDSPLIGTVAATWQQGAIRLTLQPADGPSMQVGRFHRIEGPRPELLSPVTTVVDLRGMYLATLRDAQGNDAGWLRVRISPYQDARRIYDASLPASVSEPLAAAAVVLVNSDVSYIRSRAVDVYMGN